MHIVGGQIVYDPTQVAALQALAAGERMIDTFSFTVSDLEGQTATAMVQVIVQSPTNVDPVAGPGNIAITEDGDYDGSSVVQFANDPDALPGDPPLHAIAGTVTSSAGALVTVAADGTFSYDINDSPTILALLPGQTLTDTFTYQVADFQNGMGSGTITLTVTGTGAPPTAVDYFFTIDKTDILTVPVATGVLSQDSARGTGNVLVVDTSLTDPESAGGAAILMRTDGSFEYDPSGAFPSLGVGRSYDDTFTYVIVDSYGQSAMAVVHVHVDGVEDPPIAPDYDILSGFWVPSDGVMNVSADRGLLSGASSPNEGVTSQLIAFGKGPSVLGATVIVNPDGSFTYDPTSSAQIQQLTAQGQDVVDTFSYGIIDPNGPVIDPTVTVVVKAGHPPYAYDIVASTASPKYVSLGTGPSINNAGHVAFEGVNADQKDNLWIWYAARARPSDGRCQPTNGCPLDPGPGLFGRGAGERHGLAVREVRPAGADQRCRPGARAAVAGGGGLAGACPAAFRWSPRFPWR